KLFFITFTISSISFLTFAQASLLLDRIVAIVENDVITESELNERMSVIKTQSGGQTSLPSDDILADQVLQRIIIERLQVDWGERRGITIDDLSLDQAMRNLAQRNNLDLNQFRQALTQQGIDYVTFREQVRTEMTIAQTRRRAVDSNIQVSDKEIDALLESQQEALNQNNEYRLAHILIQLPQDPTPEDIEVAKTEIDGIRQKALDGDSFTQLAISYSQADDALEGGDLGWRNINQLPGIFQRQLISMQPGDISEVIRSGSGFHVFRILDIRGEESNMVEQVLVRHILIRVNEVRTDEEVETDLNNLRERIINGDDFGELARAHSEDPGSSVNGGEVGWASPSVFAPTFREVTETLELNTISAPFKSRFGWHILEVMDRRQHDNSVDALREEARNYLRARKISEETELWLRQLRDESFVEIKLDEAS
ncbi:MAG: peptidylprolyl isomerase, partial [Pseudomonadota bacterium]